MQSSVPEKKKDCGPPFKLTKEEKEVLRGCRNTAFLYRGLPLGVGAGAGIYWASTNGWSVVLYCCASNYVSLTYHGDVACIPMSASYDDVHA
jgi:hypothetical protein